jgi:hypothetical protein
MLATVVAVKKQGKTHLDISHCAPVLVAEDVRCLGLLSPCPLVQPCKFIFSWRVGLSVCPELYGIAEGPAVSPVPQCNTSRVQSWLRRAGGISLCVGIHVLASSSHIQLPGLTCSHREPAGAMRSGLACYIQLHRVLVQDMCQTLDTTAILGCYWNAWYISDGVLLL